MASLFVVSLVFLLGPFPCFAVHKITVKSSTQVRLSSLTWDPIGKHFIAGSNEAPTLYAISDDGTVEHLLSDRSLNNTNDSVSSVVVDHTRYRLIVAFSISSSVAAYDLKSHQKICGIPLPQLEGTPAGVAVDAETGDVFVTSSTKGIVLKVRLDDHCFIVSEFKIMGDQGLGGIVHVNDNQNSYILVIQTTTGKIFKVGTRDGMQEEVLSIGKSKTLAPKGRTIALYDDLSLIVADNNPSIHLLESCYYWRRATVHYDMLFEDWVHIIAVTIRDGKKAYVLINSPILYMIVELQWWRYRVYEVWMSIMPLLFILSFGTCLVLSITHWTRRFHQEN